jgi:hypothetical protein
LRCLLEQALVNLGVLNFDGKKVNEYASVARALLTQLDNNDALSSDILLILLNSLKKCLMPVNKIHPSTNEPLLKEAKADYKRLLATHHSPLVSRNQNQPSQAKVSLQLKVAATIAGKKDTSSMIVWSCRSQTMVIRVAMDADKDKGTEAVVVVWATKVWNDKSS